MKTQTKLDQSVCNELKASKYRMVHHVQVYQHVYPPLNTRISTTFVGIVRMNFCTYFTSMFCQTTWIFFHKSSLHVGEVPDNLKRLSPSFYKCSMEFKSRDCGGHSNTKKIMHPQPSLHKTRCVFWVIIMLEDHYVSSRFCLPMVSSNSESKMSR